MNYSIRLANQNDVDTIWELGKNINEFETSEDIVMFWPKSILKDCINKSDVMILVAENEDKIIGFYIININLSFKKAELENMYVINEYRHKGIGKALLNRSLDKLSEIGIENVCALSDDAVDFLVRNGFSKGNQFYWMDLALDERFKREEFIL